MTLLKEVKPRLGVFYSDANKDREIQSMINGAVSYFNGAGWGIDSDSPEPSPLAIEAVVLYCKMAQSADPSQLINHPVLISFIAQNRGGSNGNI